MRKKWLVVTLVLSFMAMAMAAEAGTVPDRFNGTRWRYTGLQFAHSGASFSGTQSAVVAQEFNSLYSTSKLGLYNATGILVYNATRGADGGRYDTTFANGNATWSANSTDSFINVTNGTTEFLTYRWSNSTSMLSFINNPSASLFVSLGNKTAAATNDADGGTHMGFMVQNLTLTNNVTDIAGTWYFYSLSGEGNPVTGKSYGKAALGALSLGSTGTGSASFYTVSSNGTNATGTDTLTWTMGPDKQSIAIDGTYIKVLYGYLDSSKKFLVGMYGMNATAETTYLPAASFIALRSGSTWSSSLFTDAGYKAFTLSRGNQTQDNSANATATAFFTDSSRKILAGNQTTTSGQQQYAYNGRMYGAQTTVGSLTLGGVTHSTLSLLGKTLIGRQVNDIIAGIEVDGSGLVGLTVMTPYAASVSAPAAPAASEVNTLNTSFTVTGATGTAVSVYSGTEIEKSAVTIGTSGAYLDTLAGQLTNATSDAIKTQFSLGSSATVDRNYPFLNFAVTGIGTGNMTVRKMTFAGTNKLISQLPTPTKFYVEKVTTKAGTVHAMNSTKAFTYRNAGTAITDGSYWITPSGFPTLTLNYNDANRLALGSNYDMWFAILDDGDYDLDPTDGQIADPAGFVAGLGGGGGIGGSSDDNGCVLNPVAGFSVELLLLLLAPLAYFIRRKK